MVICPKCKKELEEGTKFCDECGTKIESCETKTVQTIFCSNCGHRMTTEYAFCEACGTPLNEEVTGENETAKEKEASKSKETIKSKEVSKTKETPKLEESKKPDTTPKPKKKINIVPLVALAGIAIVVFGISKLFSGGTTDYGMYIKDGEIYYTDFGKNPKQVTENLLDGSEMYDGFSSEIGVTLINSEDGKHIIYPDKIGYDGAELFYKNLAKKNAKAVKIDSDMWAYAVNDKFDCITYVDNYGGALYQHDLKDKEKIGRDIAEFDVSADGKKVVYYTTDDDFYLWQKGKDSEKIASGIDKVYSVSQDLSTIYYEKEGSFYKHVIGKDKEKIDSEFKNILKVYDSGEVYYTKEEIIEVNLMDYVEDDMRAVDNEKTEPEVPKVPQWKDYSTDEEYDAACQEYRQKLVEYNEEYNEYRAKFSRENLRQQLNDYHKQITKLCLYYYDGTTSTLVSDALEPFSAITVVENTPVAEIKAYVSNEIEKVKISEISYSGEVSNLVDEALRANVEHYVVTKNTMNLLNQNDASNIVINDSGSILYFTDDTNSDYEGDLYQVKISNNKVGEPELFDTDVKGKGEFLSDEIYVYFKSWDYDSGDLFVNGKEVDYDVYIEKYYLDENTGYIYYYTDWDGAMGTLKRYKNGESEKISDDVHMYHVTSEGTLVYIYDYDPYDQVGDMYLYNNGKPKMIVEEVNGIITDATEIDDSERGFNYGW